MKNYGFEVSLNGKKLCRAGFDTKYSVITTILTWFRRKLDEDQSLDLHVGGLNENQDQSYYWIEQPVKLDDEITIKIIDKNFDEGILKEKQLIEEDIIKDKIAYYHQLKEELKEHLNE